LQIVSRRRLVCIKRQFCSDIWPIDECAAEKPRNWSGWPDNKQFALVLTHDVETEKGQQKCRDLIELEETLGFRSSFNFVPERYAVSSELRQIVVGKNFEVGVHGLNHDGKLYKSKQIFEKRAAAINRYLKKWGAVGFRSPSMHHNLDWIHGLNIEYDASTYDTAVFEFKSQGACTIFPFWVQQNDDQKGYVEMPYTLPQDFYLFVLMKEKNIDIWKKKLDWIAKCGGMALMNTHPDYMFFKKSGKNMEQYPAGNYREFLQYINAKYKNRYWHVLPKDLALFWSKSFGN
jgi:hypothetical protein